MAAETLAVSVSSTPAPCPAGRFVLPALPCGNADDVRHRARLVRAWRSRQWPAQPPRPAPLPVPLVPTAKPMAILERMQAAPVIGRVSVASVLEATATHFGLTVEAVRSHVRTQPLVRRRQIAMYVAHKVTGRSSVFIARHVGGRDHTTILHGVRRVEARIDAGDSEAVVAVEHIVAKLTGGARV
jgi:Bacterial dnaA protein helix-turn-helix